MNREIVIRNYEGNKHTVIIPNFEKVLSIICKIIIQDETLTIIYDDGETVYFDSDIPKTRIYESLDEEFTIYKKGVLDRIDEFSKRESTFEDWETEEVEE